MATPYPAFEESLLLLTPNLFRFLFGVGGALLCGGIGYALSLKAARSLIVRRAGVATSLPPRTRGKGGKQPRTSEHDPTILSDHANEMLVKGIAAAFDDTGFQPVQGD